MEWEIEAYWRTIRDITKHRLDANADTIAKWEKLVEKLRQGVLNCSDRKEEKGWPVGVLKERKFRAWMPQWQFESSWGKGPGLEEELAPDEVPQQTLK